VVAELLIEKDVSYRLRKLKMNAGNIEAL